MHIGDDTAHSAILIRVKLASFPNSSPTTSFTGELWVLPVLLVAYATACTLLLFHFVIILHRFEF